jgi:hypothetical protein
MRKQTEVEVEVGTGVLVCVAVAVGGNVEVIVGLEELVAVLMPVEESNEVLGTAVNAVISVDGSHAEIIPMNKINSSAICLTVGCIIR